ncbi:MAG TPA: TonB-dependent receptor plug domain-containing protein, partial [Oleiagrimonas sp.]|nr:TonB-dependent receptor plug domain-containing protein [Oleiagrimonas sp.]
MRTRILPYCIAVAVAGSALFSTGVAAWPSAPDTGAQSSDTSQSQLPASASSSPPSAQLGTIIVTANKRSQALEDVPMAVTALPGYQLDRASAFSFSDYASRVPGLNLISSGEGHTQLVLRGVTSGSTQPNATVGTYIDGVPYGSSTVYALGSILTPDIDPADLKRIEVLRGPQGTLYGSNTLGGLIKFVTTPPDTSHAAARVKVGYRSIEGGGAGFATHAMVNVPLKKDELGLRVNAYHRDDPGYIDNVATGQSDVNQADVDGARAQLLWTPSDAFSARLWALAQNLDSDGLANQGVDVSAGTLKPIYGDLKRSHPPSTGLFKLKYRLYALSLNADLGWASLVSVSSYSTLRMNMVKDVTTAFGPILGPALGVPGAGFSLHKPVSMDKYTQELRLQSSGEREVEWRAGIYYTHER